LKNKNNNKSYVAWKKDEILNLSQSFKDNNVKEGDEITIYPSLNGGARKK